MSSPRVWHISGANTGLGLELALKAIAEGDRVIAAVRSPHKVPDTLKREEVKVLQFDLAWSQDQMDAYAKEAFEAFGKIDVLVNNAGYAYMGAIEESEYVLCPTTSTSAKGTLGTRPSRHSLTPTCLLC